MRSTTKLDSRSLAETAPDHLEQDNIAGGITAEATIDPDGEYAAAWQLHDQIDRCDADIEQWERLKTTAMTSSDAVIAEDRLKDLRAERLRLLEKVEAPLKAPLQASRIDWPLLATPEQLIAAFKPSTDMEQSWFDKLKDQPGLQEARVVKGISGRRPEPPWFCPYLVMQWLINPRRKVGRPIRQERAWALLQQHFPKVYNEHSVADPREADE